MLIREGDARNIDTDRRLACSLASVAGALNVCAFQAVGFFSANMTGNVSLLSLHSASADLANGLLFLAIVLAFIAGATFSTVIVNAGKRRGVTGIYVHSILVEATMLSLLGGAEFWLPPASQATILVVGLSFLMGLQNAIVTQISNARVRTTHVSGMSTDIGIGCGLLLDIARGADPRSDRPEIIARLRLHSSTVLAFFIGGVAGVFLFHSIGVATLFVAAAALFLIAGTGVLRLRRLTRTSYSRS